ncbi:NADH-quinone oxidoreductase subunit F [Oceanibacterium hippocampi]|uniref:NADH-quinone oxidoreductase subunit F n=1 Tax=Oceanibacterium hippocampi TaxID=745714 RepID=A0A1Y5TQJ1_9PROT|nr:NAD(P)H-dependent oxidoreductase subunit E [Oceanibacterium hippocampi]SLN69693.1 NADH-quinone oxidoreductase subunit F [Oceanibacterium hippocampi]
MQERGRQARPEDRNDVRALLVDDPRRPDLLIEYLHRIQDRYGRLAAGHLAALAEEMRLSLSEVYEVATFYHNFDVVTDETAKPVALTIRVCDSLSCALAGAAGLQEALVRRYGGSLRVTHAACMGRCDMAPVVRVGGETYVERATADSAAAATEVALKGEAPPALPDYPDLVRYRADGGYRLLESCRSGTLSFETLVERLEKSGLRGLGGAGFPTGRKWRFVRQEPGPRLVAVNADESEPGTFKDRHFLLSDPHRMLEGILIAAWAMEADEAYIFLRDEYADARAILTREIAALEQAGLAGGTRIILRRGAGAYICGEESAMLESLEGKRALPRHKPPFPSQVGLFGRPTLINNVETLFWVRDIVEKGPDWFAEGGRNGSKGFRSFSVSGRVREPGVKIAPAGITARELIDEFCGGMADGKVLKGYLPGGASGGILPASMADLPLDFGTLEAHGCFIGSAAVIVLAEGDDIADVARNLMEFFEDESCGQCTPCRVGAEKTLALMAAERWDRPLLGEVARCMTDASICGLGQAAPNGLLSLFRYFPEDVR